MTAGAADDVLIDAVGLLELLDHGRLGAVFLLEGFSLAAFLESVMFTRGTPLLRDSHRYTVGHCRVTITLLGDDA